MKLKPIIILFAGIITAGACARHTESKTANETAEETPPLVLLCSDIDYNDTTALHDKKIMKKRIAKIVSLLPHTDSVATERALAILFNGMKQDNEAIEETARLLNHYLNHPSSPRRNETIHIQVLKSLLRVDSLPEAVKLRAEQRLRTASLNRPGTMATDFRFEDRNGNHYSLHDTPGNEILLIFYDPECPHCSDILRNIAADEAINELISHEALTVIAIYAEGKRDVWDSTKWGMPLNWIVGYDQTGILDNDLYDLPAMPISYLLDSDKRVILKDPSLPHLHKTLLHRHSLIFSCA